MTLSTEQRAKAV